MFRLTSRMYSNFDFDLQMIQCIHTMQSNMVVWSAWFLPQNKRKSTLTDTLEFLHTLLQLALQIDSETVDSDESCRLPG